MTNFHGGARPEGEYVEPWQSGQGGGEDQHAAPVIKAQDTDDDN